MNPNLWFPPEWHLHEATWLSWPHNRDTWPNGIELIYPSYAEFVKTVAQAERVRINVVDGEMKKNAVQVLGDFGVDLTQVDWFMHPTQDAWIRDHGPAFLINHQEQKLELIHWEYNAWGGKYPPFDLDARIPQRIADELNLPVSRPGIVLEGGALDFNGQGTVITTESCLLHPNRNPHLDKRQLTDILLRHYNLKQILWLGEGIDGDDTDGHVDDLTRFVSEDTVITMVEANKEDINYAPLQENLSRLNEMTLYDGRPLKVVPVQLPQPCYWKQLRLPASYANFYICNAAVIVPTFKDPQDQQAIKLIADHFPDRPTVGIDSTHLIGGLGSFHCLSQQQPALGA